MDPFRNSRLRHFGGFATLIDAAATPPFQGGEYCLTPIHSHLHTRRLQLLKRKEESYVSPPCIRVIYCARTVNRIRADCKIPDRRSDDREYSSGDHARGSYINARGRALSQPHQGVQRHMRQPARRSTRLRTDYTHQECASTQCPDYFEFATSKKTS